MTAMRAKLQVVSVEETCWGCDGKKSSELLEMFAVSAKQYSEKGDDENNTYAHFTPSAKLIISIDNPTLWGKFIVGQQYYVDFTLAEGKG